MQWDGNLGWKALESWTSCPTTTTSYWDLFWGTAKSLSPLSVVADTLFSTAKEAAELWQCHRQCVGHAPLFGCDEGEEVEILVTGSACVVQLD